MTTLSESQQHAYDLIVAGYNILITGMLRTTRLMIIYHLKNDV